ncbi:MAG: hypothetical protein NZ930_07395 [Candidatus Bipolaricaulota bacterium]|nr:hypothetical protein [Candidatus Bipolaricaulota bacterium]MDW8031640.1 hypothetical protein [Candidatus Bipolaricaulota bacterium]
MSQEMQVIIWIVLLALLIALAWASWRRTARQSLTVLFLAVGMILVVGGGIPLIWWQIHLPKPGDQPLQIRDHRLVSQTQINERGFVRLEAEIEIILPRLTQDRLQAIADEYLKEALAVRRPDIASVRLKDFTRPVLYKYAYRKTLSPESLRPWLQPTSSEIVAGTRLEEPVLGEMGDYHTITILVTATAKWENLRNLLGEQVLPQAWSLLDESLYDYIVIAEDERPRMIVVFALLTEEFLQQYQGAGGRPEELGLLQDEIPLPSLLVLAYAFHESLFRISDITLVQKREEDLRRYEPGELAVREHSSGEARPPWLALVGNFPSFPNVLAHIRAGARILGLVRLPDWLDPAQGLQVYYKGRIATFGRKL